MKLHTVAVLFVSLAVVFAAAAQDAATQANTAKHHHYKLIDLGTLGGPQSIIYESATRPLNNQGIVTGCADTSIIDSNNPQNPYFLYPNGVIDPYIQHVFRWVGGAKTDLRALPGGTSSCMQWINEAGVIVGGSTNGLLDSLTGYPQVNAVIWSGGGIQNLGTLGGYESLASEINDAGTVAGWALNATPDDFTSAVFAFGATQAHAVRWQGGVIQDLGTLGGPDSAAYFVNARGQIAGQSLTNSTPNATTGIPTQDPFLWYRGQMIDLGTLGGTNGYPLSINNGGQVVGQSNLAGDQIFHPFFWDRGIMTDLGTFGGNYGTANWLNDAGEVVGWALYPGDQVFRPFRWKNGHMTDLGSVSDDNCGIAFGINSAGQVVGSSGDCQGNGIHAFLWEKSEIVDLNTLIAAGAGLQLNYATNVNDRGEVAGTGLLPNGDRHAYLLIPCDDDHSDVEGCDYSIIEASAGQGGNPPARSSAVTQPTVNQVPNRLMQHHRLPGQPIPRD